MKEDSPFSSFQEIEPKDISDGWEIATPESENIDGQLLEEVFQNIHNEGDIFQVRSLLVFRKKKLVPSELSLYY